MDDDKSELIKALAEETRKITIALRDVGYYVVNLDIIPMPRGIPPDITIKARYWRPGDRRLIDNI
jgi:hypothetical protein